SSFCKRNTVVEPEKFVVLSLETEPLEVSPVGFLFDDNRYVLQRVPKLLRQGLDGIADYALKISPFHDAVAYM
ncbi:MAG: hypothetical protein AMS18_13525, partial [Gemmatimonas sp. SG8_17]